MAERILRVGIPDASDYLARSPDTIRGVVGKILTDTSISLIINFLSEQGALNEGDKVEVRFVSDPALQIWSRERPILVSDVRHGQSGQIFEENDRMYVYIASEEGRSN